MDGRATTAGTGSGDTPGVGVVGAAHLVGIGGAGMRSLAEVLSGMGWRISGSDAAISDESLSGMSRRGWRVARGHAAGNLPAVATCCLYSPAVPEENVERAEARRRSLPEWSYHEMIGRLMSGGLMSGGLGIGIAGTHGKSTTTALVGWILSQAGRTPAVLCGAEWSQAAGELAGTSGLAGSGPEVVAECCEYRRHFLAMRPRMAAVLSVEPDHFDCYANFEETRAAFREFVAGVPSDGVVILPREIDPKLKTAVRGRVVEVEFLGNGDWEASWPHSGASRTPHQVPEVHSNWWAGELRTVGPLSQWRLGRRGEAERTVAWRLFGEHNVRNALIAAAVCGEAGLTLDEITAGLESFPGLRRRFEVLGEFAGRLLVDDYAHHPTEIAATISAARRHFPDRRLVVCFQPHQVSRTEGLFQEFAAALAGADEVALFPVFPAREVVTEATVAASRALAETVNRVAVSKDGTGRSDPADRGICARFYPSLDLPTFSLEDSTFPGDLVIAMGAGDIGRIHYAFIRRIQGDHAG